MMYGYEDTTPRDHYDAILDHLDSMHDGLERQIDTKEKQIQVLEARVDRLLEDAMAVSVNLADQTAATNTAYSQRTIAAVAFAHTVLSYGGTAGVGLDDRTHNPDELRVVLYVDTPAGQLSWHIAPDDQLMLKGLPRYKNSWDGRWNSADTQFYKGFIE